MSYLNLITYKRPYSALDASFEPYLPIPSMYLQNIVCIFSGKKDSNVFSRAYSCSPDNVLERFKLRTDQRSLSYNSIDLTHINLILLVDAKIGDINQIETKNLLRK